MSDARSTLPDRSRRRWRMAAIFAGVAVIELGLFLLLGQVKGRSPEMPIIEDRPFEVVLYDPPPPRSDQPPAAATGGGAPAAPSRTHTPPPPKVERPRELPAPQQQAPEQPAVVVGAAPEASSELGFGQGGQGTGSGTGVGSGSGPGSGSTGPRLVTGPTIAQVRANHPVSARTRYGRVEMSCRIRLDTRLESCRVVSENPPGFGFGQAGLAVAGIFRFQPPTENGRPVEGQQVTVGVDFGRPPR